MDVAAVGPAVTAASNDANHGKIAQEIANGCAAVTDDDRCEAAFKIILCLHNGAQEKGIDRDDFS